MLVTSGDSFKGCSGEVDMLFKRISILSLIALVIGIGLYMTPATQAEIPIMPVGLSLPSGESVLHHHIWVESQPGIKFCERCGVFVVKHINGMWIMIPRESIWMGEEPK